MVCGIHQKIPSKYRILTLDHIYFFLRAWIAGRLVKALGGRWPVRLVGHIDGAWQPSVHLALQCPGEPPSLIGPRRLMELSPHW